MLTKFNGNLFSPDENNLLKLYSCRSVTSYYNSFVPGAFIGHLQN